MSKRYFLFIMSFIMLFSCAGLVISAPAITEQELKDKIEQASKNLKDISMVGNVTYQNKKALAKVDSNYARLYEFKTANVAYKLPDKLRIEGKLGMVKFEYIINGGIKLFRAPTLRMNKKEDYSKDPAKLQNALDLALLTPTLWQDRKIEIVEDAEACSNGEIKLCLRWPKGDMAYYVWIDAQNLWLKKLEKRDGQNNLRLKVLYSNPQKVGDVIWMPTKVELYSSEGEKAGVSEYSNIKVNTGLADSLFD